MLPNNVLNKITIMGVLNMTPDSFSDGGKYTNSDAALKQALLMIEQGANIIDVGGESTRPRASKVLVSEELDRVIPIIEKIRLNSDVIISIDTSKPQVMQHAVSAGATLINDVNALQEHSAIETVKNLNVDVCLMHMQGTPTTMQKSPSYSDVVNDIKVFLQNRIDCCVQAGVAREKIIIDPGFGFGKTVNDNLLMLKRLEEFKSFGLAILVGLSRKSMLASITNRDVDLRLAGSLTLATLAVLHGATIVRVHDVAQTVDAVKVLLAMLQAK
ncbi:Dihydropteroate synthase [hydrothermal vent metagenome]|uniref:dihydropteroate synthase n=1 Tax=hydrothermal vent metagenome TaxID=652676 RepID=A0A3B1B2Q2_9ZZZZ